MSDATVNRSYTIGQLARAAGVPTSTVRYYERARLIRTASRSEANYRVYDSAALERLVFIRAAQAIGFTLEDIAALLDFRDGTSPPCKEVQTMIETRLSEVDRRSKELAHVQAILKASLRKCRQAEQSGRCEVIERLKTVSASAPGKIRRQRTPRS